jgi:hypothetical protein
LLFIKEGPSKIVWLWISATREQLLFRAGAGDTRCGGMLFKAGGRISHH